MAGINIVGSKIVDRAQSLIVVLLLAVFAIFIVVTLADIDLDLLAFSGYPPFNDIIASVALTFFAYLGFSVITFAAGDLRDPTRELPKAMYLALGVTTVLYVLIALGVFGTLTVPEVIGYGETAIAEAARPTLGDAGFTMMAIAALLATSSSVNATLYASGGLTKMLAGVGQFPPFFGPRLAARRACGHADHGRDRARGQQPRRPLRDRVGGERLLARDLPPRRRRRLPAARGHGRERRDRARRDRGDGCRPRLLRRRHAAQRSRDVHRDRGDHRAGRGARPGLEAEPRHAAADPDATAV